MHYVEHPILLKHGATKFFRRFQFWNNLIQNHSAVICLVFIIFEEEDWRRNLTAKPAQTVTFGEFNATELDWWGVTIPKQFLCVHLHDHVDEMRIHRYRGHFVKILHPHQLSEETNQQISFE